MNGLTDKVAIITGAAAGIGRCIAEALLQENCDVAMLDREGALLEQTGEQLKSVGIPDRMRLFEVDVREASELLDVAQKVARLYGRIDIVVNCAGIVRVGPFCDISQNEWKEVLDINLNGVFNTCQATIPVLQKTQGGSIINVASWFGKIGRPYYASYCASKFAIIGLTQVLALELASKKIRVNAVCPGTVGDTQMREYADVRSNELGIPDAKERISQIPLGRLASPRDIADMVAFLVSDKADYITGQAINVTGGLWML